MKLVIAEKPSLARSIMQALETTGEVFSKEEAGEYFKSKTYYVTSQFGHLFGLKMPNEYKENEGKSQWDISFLPFFPEKYEYKLMKDCGTRFKTIKSLLNKSDIDEVIHCGDPDREGQILVDIVLKEANCKKPVTRPQLNALTNEAIIKAFKERKDNSLYHNLHDEGIARQYFDYDYGMNLSKYVTIKTSAKPALSVGRVIGAITYEIYKRDMAIKNFVPEKFYKVSSDIEGIKLTSKNRFKGDEFSAAKEYSEKLQSGETKVTNVTKKETIKKSPKLFSMTSLQSAMNQRFGFSPDKTLSLAQSLYEAGYTSYPRTNTEYMSSQEKDAVKSVIIKVDASYELIFKDKKSIFDDSKIEGHTAIIPTGKMPNSLSEDEEKCYMTILNRFKAVFCKEECIYDSTTIDIHNPTEDFTLKGETEKQTGWKKFEPKKEKKDDKKEGEADDEPLILPPLKIGDIIKTDFKPEEAETTPPKHHTVDSLGKWMQNPFKSKDQTEEEEYKNILAGLEIGTEATRAGILLKAEKQQYLKLTKSTYSILPRGIFLVEACEKLGIDLSKETTANMGKMIKDVGRGERTIRDILEEEQGFIREVILANKETLRADSMDAPLGKCPKCGKPVLERKSSFQCSSNKFSKDDNGTFSLSEGCGFSLPKVVAKKGISASQMQSLLKNGITPKMSGFVGSKGKFSAKLKLKSDKSGYEFVFDAQKGGKSTTKSSGGYAKKGGSGDLLKKMIKL